MGVCMAIGSCVPEGATTTLNGMRPLCTLCPPQSVLRRITLHGNVVREKDPEACRGRIRPIHKRVYRSVARRRPCARPFTRKYAEGERSLSGTDGGETDDSLRPRRMDDEGDFKSCDRYRADFRLSRPAHRQK